MKWGRPLTAIITLSLLALFTLASACSPRKAVPAGPQAPDFTVKTIDGSQFTLSRQRGKVVVLDFIIANCPSCVVEFPALAKIYDEYKGHGLEVLVLDVSPYETEADLLEAKRRFGGGEHLWAVDQGQRVTLSYGVRTLGTTVIIDQQGDTAYRDAVPTSYEQLKEAVKRLFP